MTRGSTRRCPRCSREESDGYARVCLECGTPLYGAWERPPPSLAGTLAPRLLLLVVAIPILGLLLGQDVCSAGPRTSRVGCGSLIVGIGLVLIPLLALILIRSELRDRRWRSMLESARQQVLEAMGDRGRHLGWALIVEDGPGKRRAVVRGSPSSVTALLRPGRGERVEMPIERWDGRR